MKSFLSQDCQRINCMMIKIPTLYFLHKGRMAVPTRMNFRKSSKGSGGGQFQSKHLYRRLFTFIQGFKHGFSGNISVWNEGRRQSENSSVLEPPHGPKNLQIHFYNFSGPFLEDFRYVSHLCEKSYWKSILAGQPITFPQRHLMRNTSSCRYLEGNELFNGIKNGCNRIFSCQLNCYGVSGNWSCMKCWTSILLKWCISKV